VTKASKIVLRKTEWKRPFVNPRYRWKDTVINVKKQSVGRLTGFIWLQMMTSGGLL
jgi:hypothetical protein